MEFCKANDEHINGENNTYYNDSLPIDITIVIVAIVSLCLIGTSLVLVLRKKHK